MLSFDFIISDPIGLHLKPASKLAEAVAMFKSKVFLTANGLTVDASKVISIISLGVVTGSEIIVSIEGEDEQKTYSYLLDFCNRNL